jgi:GTP-binding protein Era
MNEDTASVGHCGYVAIVGRPNVGKSTLLNHLLGQKLSITSRKPQTTRHQILGIKTTAGSQIIFVDTPGIHAAGKNALNRFMNKAALTALLDVDIVVLVADAGKWREEDDYVLQHLQELKIPVLLAVNKVDQFKDKCTLLPLLDSLQAKREFAEIIPVSALNGHNLEMLEKAIICRLPEGQPFYPEDQFTDRSERFLAAEMVREKVMRQLGQELPYEITVEIDQFKHKGNCLHIGAVILVDKPSQKSIVIGKAGSRLKSIGKEARLDMEKLFGCKVMLSAWVKVKGGWSDDERTLRSLGYDDR